MIRRLVVLDDYIYFNMDNAQVKKRILVIEDEKYLRELYLEILKDEGYEVVGAANGEEGLNAMKAGGYDLVLLDIMLPKMDGISILKKIKEEQPQKPNGVVVILSNLGQDNVIAEGISLGARGYMVKSDYTPDQVVAEVKNYLTQ